MSESANQPGFWTRFGRALSWSLVTLLKMIFVIAMLALLVIGGWFVAITVDGEYRAVQERLAVLEFAAGNSDEQNFDQQTRIAELEMEVARLQQELDDSSTTLAADLSGQEADLAALTVQVSDTISATDGINANLALVEMAIVSLQSDLNANALEIDALGGISDTLTVRVSDLGVDLAALDASLAELDANLPDVQQTQTALSLFRLWQLMARARLQLAEANIGLASTDIGAAAAAVSDLLAATSDEATIEALTLIATRMSLAQAQLPGDPAAAARDLDAAWETVDLLLLEVLGSPAPTAP